MTSRPRRRRVEPTDEWEQIELLCGWPEQRDYELILPLVLFGAPADKASSGRTLRRRAARFDAEGMDSLFGSEAGRRRRLPPAMRRLIVDLKAEHPGLNPNEIARVCHVRFGRRPARKTVKRVLAEEPLPLRFVRRFPRYHDIPERRDGRAAVVALHADGWSAKAISGYLKVGTSTVYRILKRWAEEGPAGLEDKPHGRPPGVRKVTLKAMEALAGREAALWLAAESLTVEHAGEPLSRYAVKVEASTGELRSVARPRLFETSHGLRQPQHRLFALDSLGECGWLKALRLEGYAPRRPRGPLALQQALFPYAEAL